MKYVTGFIAAVRLSSPAGVRGSALTLVGLPVVIGTMHRLIRPNLAVAVAVAAFGAALAAGATARAGDSPTAAAAVRVATQKSGGAWQLVRDGRPYFIKGAGGDGPIDVLAQLGGNSLRTWGVGNDTGRQLDEAQRLGLTVTLGIWLRREGDGGFSYHDPKQVAAQRDKAIGAIRKYKDHPAVLMWGIGNEMEGFKGGDDPAVWEAVEEIAREAKRIDPNHPTMTVVAEIGGARVKSIHERCPDIDVVGINSYGGAASVGERYRKAGGTKPYVVTEFGPPGTWEGPKTSWGVPLEPSSTRKGEMYRQAYTKGVLAQKGLCLGSYAFVWGHKQEATPTWYGLFLPDGTQLEGVHVLAELWSGHAPANRCPRMDVPKVDAEQVSPGQVVSATLAANDPDGDPLSVTWVLTGEVKKRSEGGGHEDAAPDYPEAIIQSDAHGARVKMPREPGTYRLFAYVRDGRGNGAVSNVVLRVRAEAR